MGLVLGLPGIVKGVWEGWVGEDGWRHGQQGGAWCTCLAYQSQLPNCSPAKPSGPRTAANGTAGAGSKKAGFEVVPQVGRCVWGGVGVCWCRVRAWHAFLHMTMRAGRSSASVGGLCH